MNYEYYMKMALREAEDALAAGEFPVGSVLVYQGEVLVTGARTGTLKGHGNEVDHAEMVVLRRLAVFEREVDRRKTTLFCTMEPCLMCLGALILSNIGRVVYAYEDVMGGGTKCDLDKLPPLYRNRPISIVGNVLRRESLELFRAYFANPENDYWRESLLARYTLGQT